MSVDSTPALWPCPLPLREAVAADGALIWPPRHAGSTLPNTDRNRQLLGRGAGGLSQCQTQGLTANDSARTIKHLRTAEFKPYVVMINPPGMERLRETRKNAKVISGKDDKGIAKPFTEEDYQEMIISSQLMESQYGHLFEKAIVNDDLTTAFNELKAALQRVETDTHWVPVSWTHS
ncbi:MAGUK p55 subfamily member 7 [Osmerus mordax]|uniref:MAGUK p55 subfamily member 7 n=1 Tax=Osmerus mordax TaxID=8014 RepID=UPI0035100A3F